MIYIGYVLIPSDGGDVAIDDGNGRWLRDAGFYSLGRWNRIVSDCRPENSVFL